MTRWEIRWWTERSEQSLEQLGAEGWEPVSAVTETVYHGPEESDSEQTVVLLKRPSTPSDPTA